MTRHPRDQLALPEDYKQHSALISDSKQFSIIQSFSKFIQVATLWKCQNCCPQQWAGGDIMDMRAEGCNEFLFFAELKSNRDDQSLVRTIVCLYAPCSMDKMDRGVTCWLWWVCESPIPGHDSWPWQCSGSPLFQYLSSSPSLSPEKNI